MKRLLLAALALWALTGCTQDEIRGWLAWHANDPAAALAHLEQPEVQAQLEQADRLDPPPPQFNGASSSGRCTGAEPLLAQHSPGWSVERMSRIMYRESRCQPRAANSCCHGLLQIHEQWCGYLAARLGPCDLTNPSYNVQAAALVFGQQGYGAWSTS